MSQLINEAERMQQLANIKENKSIEQVVNEALKTHRLNEIDIPTTPTPTKQPAKKLTTDVENLKKIISSNITLVNRMKTVNNAQEVTEFLDFILNSINDKLSGVNKPKLKAIIDQRFK